MNEELEGEETDVMSQLQWTDIITPHSEQYAPYIIGDDVCVIILLLVLRVHAAARPKQLFTKIVYIYYNETFFFNFNYSRGQLLGSCACGYNSLDIS